MCVCVCVCVCVFEHVYVFIMQVMDHSSNTVRSIPMYVQYVGVSHRLYFHLTVFMCVGKGGGGEKGEGGKQDL